jgi:probable HAF family extracellular repeat protein
VNIINQKPMRKLLQSAMCAGLVSLSINSVAQTADFIAIKGLITGDYPYSNIGAISDDGTVVIGTSAIDGGGVGPYRWSNGQATYLGSLPGLSANGQGLGISGDGSVLVGNGRLPFEGTVINAAWRWTEDGGIIDLGRPSFSATDASFDGRVIIGSSEQDNSNAFRWTAETGVITLPELGMPEGGASTHANAISSNGDVIVGKSARTPFRWTESTGTVSLGDFQGEANDLTPTGDIVVGMGSFNRANEPFLNQAFRWTEEEGVLPLGLMPGDTGYSKAMAVSADGSIIVGTGLEELGKPKAFIWDAINGMRELKQVLMSEYNVDLSAWTLESATDISANGKIIAGNGFNPDGYRQGWLVNLNNISDALELKLLAPANGATYFDNDVVHLSAIANDLEEGDISNAINWSSDVDGVLGQGGQLAASLSIGDHHITAEIIDQTGDLATISLNITVLAVPELTLDVDVRGFFFKRTTVTWSGATNNVQILKNGSVYLTGGQSGSFTRFGSGSSYQVCQIDSDYCSEVITAN